METAVECKNQTRQFITLFQPYENNKDEPALISTFVVRCLDSVIPLFAISEILSLKLASLCS